jgi:hypothetical protein
MRMPLASAALLLAGCSSSPSPVEPACDEPGNICTVAGSGAASFGGDGLAFEEAAFYGPMDLTWKPGTEDFVVIDWNNHRVRLVENGVINTIIGTWLPGDGIAPVEGMPGTELSINHAVQAEYGPDGDLYVTGWHNHRLLRWEESTGFVYLIAGTGMGFAGDGDSAVDAQIAFPTSVAFMDGDLYFVDQANSRVRMVSQEGVIDTVAGDGELGYGGDGGPPMQSQFAFIEHPGPQNIPAGAIEVGEDGMLYVLDTFNGAVRTLDMMGHVVDTVIGDLAEPRDLEMGPDGRLYVMDTGHFEVRAYDLATGDYEVVAGTGVEGHGEDGVPADESALGFAHGIEFADDGALWIADTYNNRIRRVAPLP